MKGNTVRRYSYIALAGFTAKGIVTLTLIVMHGHTVAGYLARADELPLAVQALLWGAGAVLMTALLAAGVRWLRKRRASRRCPLRMEAPPSKATASV